MNTILEDTNLPDMMTRMREIGVEFTDGQLDFISGLSGKDYPDDSMGYKRAMDDLLAKIVVMTAIKIEQVKVDRKLLELLDPKGFARYKKRVAQERDERRKQHFKELYPSENHVQGHRSYLLRRAKLSDLLLGVRTSRLIHALEKFAMRAMKWERSNKVWPLIDGDMDAHPVWYVSLQ
jgi:hypothetical protein